MYSLRKRIQYLFIKKDTSVLCGLIAAMHLIMSPVTFYYHFDFLSRYHTYAGILYVIMIMLSKAIPPLFLFTMCDLESIAYCFIVTINHGNEAGAYILPLTLLTYLFMIVISSKKETYSTIIPTTLTIIVVLVLQFLNFHPGKNIVPFPKPFYLFHYSTYSITSILTICFICYVIQKKFYRFREKTRIKTSYLNYSATHDSLTKILNRRHISEMINNYSSNPEYADTVFRAAIFDIDNFKKINDTYGHNCGDVILKLLADLIHRNLPENTVFARWGGEEFLILFIGTSNDAYQVLEQIRDRVEDNSFKYFNKAIKITITIGLSEAEKSYNFQKMLIDADNNLLLGKRTGKNKTVKGESKNE